MTIRIISCHIKRLHIVYIMLIDFRYYAFAHSFVVRSYPWFGVGSPPNPNIFKDMAPLKRDHIIPRLWASRWTTSLHVEWMHPHWSLINYVDNFGNDQMMSSSFVANGVPLLVLGLVPLLHCEICVSNTSRHSPSQYLCFFQTFSSFLCLQ